MTRKRRLELLEVIDELRAADPGIDAPELADLVIARKTFWHDLRDDLARDRLITIVTSILNRAVAADEQLALPGFELIPRRLRIGGGLPVITAKATLAQLIA